MNTHPLKCLNKLKLSEKGQAGLTAERLDPCLPVLLQPADLSPQLKLHWKEKDMKSLPRDE